MLKQNIELSQNHPFSNTINQPTHEDQTLKTGPDVHQQQQPHQKHLKHTAFIYLMSLNACLGSFFFGYNLGVYNTCQKVIATLNNWSSSQNTNYTSIITAAMPLGAFIAAIFSKSLIAALKGIRRSMILFDIIGIIGTIILICQNDLSNLIIGRIISGFCIGMNTSLVPEYIRDFAPIEIRSRVGSINQILLTSGVFISYLMSLILPLPSELTDNPNGNYNVNWRIVLGLPIATCTLRLLILWFKFTHETPTIMVKQHHFQEVREYLQMVYEDDEDQKKAYSEICEVAGVESSAEQVDQLQNSVQDQNGKAIKQSDEKLDKIHKKPNQKDVSPEQSHHNNTGIDVNIMNEEHICYEKFFELLDKKSYWKRVLLGCIIQYGTQCSGVNALLFYSNQIFQQTTGSEMTSRICTIFLGLSMVVYSLISMQLVIKFGRRSIMNNSVILTTSMLVLFAILQKLPSSYGIQVTGILFIFIYMFGWQAGLGTTVWVYNNEILDRKGLAWSSFIRWLFTMIVGVVFPYMNTSIGLFGAFLIFGGLIFMCLIYFWFFMYETKGKSRLEIMKLFNDQKDIDLFDKEAKEYAKQKIQQNRSNQDTEHL
ncbi:hypothetical protein ABPG72_009994 [Tetrahymena utriculariae]